MTRRIISRHLPRHSPPAAQIGRIAGPAYCSMRSAIHIAPEPLEGCGVDPRGFHLRRLRIALLAARRFTGLAISALVKRLRNALYGPCRYGAPLKCRKTILADFIALRRWNLLRGRAA
jgi:hypothetical protein